MSLRHKNPSTTNTYLKPLGLEHTRSALEDGFKMPEPVTPSENEKSPQPDAPG